MAGSLVVIVKGRGNDSGISPGTSSRGAPASRYTLSLQLLSVAPAVEKTARTESVSTTMSRAAVSATRGVAAGTAGTDGAGAEADCWVSTAGGGEVGEGAGAGGEKKAW